MQQEAKISFETDLKVTIQDLGWHPDGRYMPLQDDIASVVFWYQSEPHGAFPVFPTKDQLEVNWGFRISDVQFRNKIS